MTFAYMLLAVAFVLCVWSAFAGEHDKEQAQGVLIPACACILLAIAVFSMATVAHNDEHHAGDEPACEELAPDG